MKKTIIGITLVPFILTSCSDISTDSPSDSSTQSTFKKQDQGITQSLSDEKLQAGITKKTQTQKQKKKKYDSKTRAS